MKRTKRKYTRHLLEVKPDALESKSSGVDEVTGVILPPVANSGFSFNDLPFSIRMQVENIIKMRERLKLPDDSKERKLLAIRYFRGDRPR